MLRKLNNQLINVCAILSTCLQYCDKYADSAGCPRVEEWRKVLCISALVNAQSNLEAYRDSYEEDEEILQVAYTSPHFTQYGPQDSTL